MNKGSRIRTTRFCDCNTGNGVEKVQKGVVGTVEKVLQVPSGTGYIVRLDDGRQGVLLFDREVEEVQE